MKKSPKTQESSPMFLKAKPMYKPSILKHEPSQSERFVTQRGTTFQYFVDVFALSFVISIVLVLTEHFVK